jgi:monoamine oxidase
MAMCYIGLTKHFQKGVCCVDWNAIKTEYITDESTSYRKLAEKYGVPLGTLYKRAKKENWVSLRKQSGDRRVAKTVSAIERKHAQKLSRIQDITDRLLDRIERAVEELDTQLYKAVVKTKEIEYNNFERPDKPTKEVIHEEERVLEVKTIVDRTGLKDIAAALKSIKEVQMLKTDLDLREQEARIRNLERQAESGDRNLNAVTVTIEGGDDSWRQ